MIVVLRATELAELLKTVRSARTLLADGSGRPVPHRTVCEHQRALHFPELGPAATGGIQHRGDRIGQSVADTVVEGLGRNRGHRGSVTRVASENRKGPEADGPSVSVDLPPARVIACALAQTRRRLPRRGASGTTIAFLKSDRAEGRELAMPMATNRNLGGSWC